MERNYFRLLTLKKLAAFFLVFSPLGFVFAGDCPAPVFSEKNHTFTGGISTADGGSLSQQIVAKLGPNWCTTDNLCPSGVVKSNGGCNDATPALISKWGSIFGNTFKEAFFGPQGTYYYDWKLCSMCPNAAAVMNGSPDNGTTTTPDNSQPPAATPGVPTSVVVGGFDKLDNPLGPANLTTVSDVIERALGIIIKVSIPFVVLMLIWTGFQFVIAQGNPTKISAAKNTFLWVVVGAAILIGCVVIANAIANSVESVAKVAGGN